MPKKGRSNHRPRFQVHPLGVRMDDKGYVVATLQLVNVERDQANGLCHALDKLPQVHACTTDGQYVYAYLKGALAELRSDDHELAEKTRWFLSGKSIKPEQSPPRLPAQRQHTATAVLA